MSRATFQYCDLPAEAPANCTFLREVPAADDQGTFVVSFCSCQDTCPLKKNVFHTIEAEITD